MEKTLLPSSQLLEREGHAWEKLEGQYERKISNPLIDFLRGQGFMSKLGRLLKTMAI